MATNKFDDLGLYYAHGRWYNPETGLWLSPDKNGSYIYFDNDPINKHASSLLVQIPEWLTFYDGYFWGISTTFGTAVTPAKVYGFEYVFDLKDRESAVFTYESKEALSLTGISLETNYYEGLIHGFEEHVIEYEGPFVSWNGGFSAQVPGYFVGGGLNATFFSSADKGTCTPNFKMGGVAIGFSQNVGVESPFGHLSGGFACNKYTIWLTSSKTYPKGLAGAYLMKLDIPLNTPFAIYAKVLADYYAMENSEP